MKITDKVGVTLILVALFIFDFAIICGILIHGKANFSELIKHLQ